MAQHVKETVSRQINLATTRCESQTIYYSLAKGPAVGVLDALYAAYFASSRKAELPS